MSPVAPRHVAVAAIPTPAGTWVTTGNPETPLPAADVTAGARSDDVACAAARQLLGVRVRAVYQIGTTTSSDGTVVTVWLTVPNTDAAAARQPGRVRDQILAAYPAAVHAAAAQLLPDAAAAYARADAWRDRATLAAPARAAQPVTAITRIR